MGKLNKLLDSDISFTIPVPLPVSSTLAIKLNCKGILAGIVKVIVPFSKPSIGIVFCVKAEPTIILST